MALSIPLIDVSKWAPVVSAFMVLLPHSFAEFYATREVTICALHGLYLADRTNYTRRSAAS